MKNLHEKVKQHLIKSCKGQGEVASTFGRIDIVSSKEIIEVSSIDSYKECIGRLLTFHSDPKYNHLKPRLHVFCKGEDSLDRFETKIGEISKVCKKYNIFLTFQINRSFYAYYEKEIITGKEQVPILPTV
jgi:hypothetical protein